MCPENFSVEDHPANPQEPARVENKGCMLSVSAGDRQRASVTLQIAVWCLFVFWISLSAS